MVSWVVVLAMLDSSGHGGACDKRAWVHWCMVVLPCQIVQGTLLLMSKGHGWLCLPCIEVIQGTVLLGRKVMGDGINMSDSLRHGVPCVESIGSLVVLVHVRYFKAQYTVPVTVGQVYCGASYEYICVHTAQIY
jgi:hypothetical protein